MRRLVLAITASVALMAVFAGSANTGTTGQKDLAVGTGTIDGFGDPMVHVNAQTNPNTGMTSGTFYIRYPAESTPDRKIFEVSGSVSCLFVDAVGNHAAVAGRIERIKGSEPAIFREATPTQIGDEVAINVIDLGSPGTLDEANEGKSAGATTSATCGFGGTL